MSRTKANLEKLIKKFMRDIYTSELPPSLRILRESNPDFLEKWLELRDIARHEGLLPLKTRHLVWLTAQAMRLNRQACAVHVKGALDAGAETREIIETAMILYITAGGTVGDTILEALKAATSIKTEESAPS
jgi:alkylhydroperoxidase/carboxymuconolactone decarboxylase family protein YurZ